MPPREPETGDLPPATCPYCGGPLGSDVVVCTRCETPHHRECAEEWGRCTTYACGGTTFRRGAAGSHVVLAAPLVPALTPEAFPLHVVTEGWADDLVFPACGTWVLGLAFAAGASYVVTALGGPPSLEPWIRGVAIAGTLPGVVSHVILYVVQFLVTKGYRYHPGRRRLEVFWRLPLCTLSWGLMQGKAVAGVSLQYLGAGTHPFAGSLGKWRIYFHRKGQDPLTVTVATTLAGADLRRQMQTLRDETSAPDLSPAGGWLVRALRESWLRSLGVALEISALALLGMALAALFALLFTL